MASVVAPRTPITVRCIISYEQCHLPMIGVLGPGFLASSAELRPSSGRAAIHGFASKIHEKSLPPPPHEKSIKSIDFIDFS